MKYLKSFNENFYVGAIWTSGNKGTDELNNTIAFPYRAYDYDDENVAFEAGKKAFENGETKNPYQQEQFPNPNLIVSWQRGYDTAKKNKDIKRAT